MGTAATRAIRQPAAWARIQQAHWPVLPTAPETALSGRGTCANAFAERVTYQVKPRCCTSTGAGQICLAAPVRTSCTVSRRPRGAARAADSAGSAALPLRSRAGWPLTPVGWREGQGRGRGTPRKSRSRGGFDPGTPRGGSIGLMRSTWEGRPIAGKRTAAAAVANPPLGRCGACGSPPIGKLRLIKYAVLRSRAS